jgi:hypothetical protein
MYAQAMEEGSVSPRWPFFYCGSRARHLAEAGAPFWRAGFAKLPRFNKRDGAVNGHAGSKNEKYAHVIPPEPIEYKCTLGSRLNAFTFGDRWKPPVMVR